MSKGFKGLIATIISLVAVTAFLVGFVATGAGGGSKTIAETVASGGSVDSEATGGNDESEDVTVTDTAGNEFKAPLDVDSVITLNPNGADMLSAFGKEGLVSGVSSDTKYPASTGSMKKYGTESNPDTENIIAAKPGAVIATSDFAKSGEYTKLKDAGIQVVCLDFNDVDTAVEESAKLGLLFDTIDQADEFITDIENIKALVSEKVAGKEETKVYWENNDDFTSVNKDGNENKILKLASAKSITEDKTDAEVKTDAAIVQSGNPEVIVKVSDYDNNVLTVEKEDLKDAEGMVDGIKKRSGFENVPAVKNNKIVVLSDRIINTPLGSAIAPLYIAKMAHPQEMQEVTPGQYLNEFLDKYWESSDLKGSLAYAGDISLEENINNNSLAGTGSTGSGVSGGSLLSSLANSNTGTTATRTVISGSPLAASSKGSLVSIAKAKISNNKTGTVDSNTTDNKTGTSNTKITDNKTGIADSKNSLIAKAGAKSDNGNNTSTNNNTATKNNASTNNNTSTKNNASTNNNASKNSSNSNTKKENGVKKQNDVSTSDKTEKVEDSTGQEITVNKDDGSTAIKSCIVFNSSVYEMIKIMGGQDTVIGCADSMTTSSDFPELAGKQSFGKWNNPNAEAIIAAKPDVVFAYANYGQDALQQIRDAGITVVSLNFYIPSEISEEIVTLGKIFGNEALANEWNKDINEIQSLVASRTKYVQRATCYWETYTDYSSVADGSGGAEILALAGVHNIYDRASAASYPKVSDEWVIQKNPDVVVKVCSSTTSSPTFCMGSTVNSYTLAKAVYGKIAGRTGWSEISAVRDEKVLLLHSKVGTTAFGCAVAPLYVAKVAYPEKFADIDADSYARAFYKKYWGTNLAGTWRFSYQNLN